MKYIKVVAITIVLFMDLFCMNNVYSNDSNINTKLEELQEAYESKNLEKAERISLESLKILRKNGADDKLLLTSVLNKLNGIYKQTDKFDDALKYILEAYEIATNKNDFPKEVLSLYAYNLAGTYKELKIFDKAVYHYEEAINMSIDLLKSENESQRGYAQFILPNSTETLIELYYELEMEEKIPELHKRIDETLLNSPM